MLTKIRKDARIAREEGQTMAEYAVVLAVITVATVAVFTALSGGISAARNTPRTGRPTKPGVTPSGALHGQGSR